MKNIILLNITGKDKPGLTSALAEILAGFNIRILDIAQSVIHHFLSLGIVIEVPPEAETSPILKDLLYKAHEQDIKITYTPIDEEQHEKWVNQKGHQRFTITLMAKELEALHIAKVTSILAKNNLNIDVITRLSGRVSAKKAEAFTNSCVELSVVGEPLNESKMRADFLKIAYESNMDIAFQKDGLFLRNKRLVAFDMDSTLIQAEVMDELAKEANVGEKVAAITSAAMRGEIDFKESFSSRLKLLKGLSVTVLDKVVNRLVLTEGAERLITVLKTLGYKIAIVSGGFNYFGNHLKEKLGLHYVYANEFEIADGKLTGNYVGEIIDGEEKASLLNELAERENISLEQIIAVGDGANDLPMLEKAGMGVAFHAKPIVKENAEHSISNVGLDAILYLLGVRERHFDQ